MVSPGAVEITQSDGCSLLHLKTWHPERTLPSSWPFLGTECRWLKFAPDEGLLISNAVAPSDMQMHLVRETRGSGIVALDVSQALAALRLKGSAVRELLRKGCGLDLHPSHFREGACTRTRFAQLPIIIDCPGAAKFDLYVSRSHLSYLLSWLSDAVVEFDGRSE